MERDSQGKFIKGHKNLGGRRGSGRIIVNCLTCSKEFSTTNYRVNNGKGKYCSKECANISFTKYGVKEVRQCKICSKEFIVKGYNKTNEHKGKFCSKECSYKGRVIPHAFKPGEVNGPKKNPKSQATIEKLRIAQRKVNRRGEASPLWKGGTRSLRERDMLTWEYREWKRNVFLRDDYTCQECKIRGGYLHADHVAPYSDYPELRHDINNGKTLCYKCHYKKTFPNIKFDEQKALMWGVPKKYRKEEPSNF